ncbi:MAG: hypothetical protein IJA36_06110 [Lachnospiraceae bacterium]|nr:hypothetical protein [Lachnospiraceae bacterium]
MQPRFKDKKMYTIMIIAVLLFGLWMGIYLSLPAKSGYSYAQWRTELNEVYKPMLKNNWYGLKNPLWWKAYTNEYTATFVVAIEAFLGCFLLYILYFAGNYIHGKEFGTAKFANPKEVNKILRDNGEQKDKLYIEKIKRG